MLDGSDLAALAALHALLETGSVTGAARRIGLSTPAMSHALARLRAR
ncbi:MAG: LysR family transcriptional regulator, partial [Myxococcales bacterium]|nr:LysR family transcriptional regulator [Myxococcales bacterium]